MNLIQMSISGAIMILAVIVIRALAINRLPKKTFLALWGIALLRLLIPFSFPSPFSAYSLVNSHISSTQGTTELFFPAPVGLLPTTDAALQAQTIGNISPYAIVWAIGMSVCILFFAISHFKCRREFRKSLPIRNDFSAQWIAKHRISRAIELRQSSRICAPLTYGIFKPIILMPKNTKWDDTKQLEYILTHEFIHIKRFDVATKLFLTAALCIHWFNPLVWAMYILSNRDIELSCDETVVLFFGETTKSAYARTLISMEEKKSSLAPLCNNFSKNAIEERITAIMKIKKTSFTALAAALLLVGGVTTAFATSSSAQADNDYTTTETTVMAQKNERNGADAPYQYSIDNGATWISEDEYNAMYPQDDIVWWTYEGYKAWVEEQKVELTKLIGTDNKYLKDGTWVSFTQQSVDESIRQYENTLEEIKNGARLSKTVNGDDSIVMISTNIPPNVSYRASITANNGNAADLGTFSSKEARLTAVKQYCAEQVDAGKMSQEEADRLIKEYE